MHGDFSPIMGYICNKNIPKGEDIPHGHVLIIFSDFGTAGELQISLIAHDTILQWLSKFNILQNGAMSPDTE